MMTRKYKIADKLIEVISLYPDVHEYCKDYAAEGVPDFSVEITQGDIDYEREKTAKEYAYEGKRAPNYSEGVLEETAVYRKIAEKMPLYDRIVFHGSVVAVDGVGYNFTAKSGTGKSTHTRLWREMLGDRAVMVNDDKPMIKLTDTGAVVYGTPYNGKHHLGNNICVPLKAICILERGEHNSITTVNKSEAYPMLLQQVYRPTDRAAFAMTLTLIDKLAEKTALYKLNANMEPQAAEVAYNAMKG